MCEKLVNYGNYLYFCELFVKALLRKVLSTNKITPQTLYKSLKLHLPKLKRKRNSRRKSWILIVCILFRLSYK